MTQLRRRSSSFAVRPGGRSVEYALEASPVSDHGQTNINAALDDQALDLDDPYGLNNTNVSVDEASGPKRPLVIYAIK